MKCVTSASDGTRESKEPPFRLALCPRLFTCDLEIGRNVGHQEEECSRCALEAKLCT